MSWEWWAMTKNNEELLAEAIKRRGAWIRTHDTNLAWHKTDGSPVYKMNADDIATQFIAPLTAEIARLQLLAAQEGK